MRYQGPTSRSWGGFERQRGCYWKYLAEVFLKLELFQDRVALRVVEISCLEILPRPSANLRALAVVIPTYLLQNLLRGSEEKFPPELNAEDLISVHLQKAALRGRPHEPASLVDPLQSVSEIQPNAEPIGARLTSHIEHRRGGNWEGKVLVVPPHNELFKDACTNSTKIVRGGGYGERACMCHAGTLRFVGERGDVSRAFVSSFTREEDWAMKALMSRCCRAKDLFFSRLTLAIVSKTPWHVLLPVCVSNTLQKSSFYF